MKKSLVIVESKTKAKTIGRYLGSGFEVKASNGHIVDLPQKELGVNIDNGFEPTYIIIPGKKKILKELKTASSGAGVVYLAMDPDREGEAIAYFIAEKLDLDEGRYQRVLFYEITKKAVEEAMKNPCAIDEKKVYAQQARRVLDRLVGYRVSPFIWRIVKPGLSAGRVQSVALRLICERENEIESFIPKEYWSITAHLLTPREEEFQARLVKVDGEDPQIDTEEEAEKIREEIGRGPFAVGSIARKERKRYPFPPFITSTLQQDASRRFGMPAARTMRIAQSLYEGVDIGGEGSVGLITYMRTDSTRISDLAISEVRSYIGTNYESPYLPASPNVYRQKGKVQDAHEAIRPTSVERTPASIKEFLTPEQQKIYGIIWQRFLASQMTPAAYDVTTVDIPTGRFLFRASGSVMKFDGFLAVYAASAEGEDNGEEEGVLPFMEEGEELKLAALTPEQHFTKPPPRFTEASLIKELETDGIGRPSTYATIMSTLMNRTYVTVERKKLIPTELGRLVSKICVGSFPELFDVGFTREMEAQLDSIEQGEREWKDVLKEFYGPFSEALARGDERSREILLEETGQENTVCDLCGKPMVVKWSRRGIFLGCSGFPECRNTRQMNGMARKDVKTEKKCPVCGSPMEVKEGRYGSFIACSRYPECKMTMAVDDDAAVKDEKCEKCGAPMVVKGGRFGKFLSCSRYPECKNTKPIPLGIPCPREGCSGELAERRTKKGKAFYGCTRYPDCDFASWEKPTEATCPSCSFAFASVKKSRGRGGEKLVCLKCGNTFMADE